MFTGFPGFIRFRGYSQRVTSGGWWLVMGPGLLLTFIALAILIWPELLAYLVAMAMLLAGLSLTIWGWTLRQAEQRRRRDGNVRYDIFS
jgi:hypothetical protein